MLGEGVARARRWGNPIAHRICYPIEPNDGLFLFGRNYDPAEEEQRSPAWPEKFGIASQRPTDN